MRIFIVLVAFWSASGFAAEPPHCTLPQPIAMANAESRVEQDNPWAVVTATERAKPLTESFAGSSFAKHLVASGASISDLGLAHGVTTVAARNRDQFMIFQIAPDGAAAVSGATVELSPDQIKRIAPGNVTQLDELHGLQGYFVRSGKQFQVFYATPDQQRLIPGVMWDATGEDLTRQQLPGVPGAIPTVEVGGSGASQKGDVATSGIKALPLLEKANFGVVGLASAPRLYMLIDPQCIYSIRAMQMLQPLVASGRVQLSVIPLSVLDYEDGGQSTRSASSLLSRPDGDIVPAWRSGDMSSSPTSEASKRLQGNMQIAQEIGVKGTPTFVWRKPDGTEGRLDGMPTSVEAILTSLGPDR